MAEMIVNLIFLAVGVVFGICLSALLAVGKDE